MGVVTEVSDKKPPYSTKPIASMPSTAITLKKWQLDLAKWMSEYYFCSLQQTLKLFIPKGKRTKKTTEEKEKSLPLHKKLTEKQQEIVKKILTSHTNGKFLIHGITGSGKTEIYLQLASEYVRKGHQVLILTPEIGLTPQLVQYFKHNFENRIALIHSQLSAGERRQEWFRIEAGQVDIVIGSRSALFQPFKNLGLIIMDEEHEWTYKQDQSPRYHARDVAIKTSELLNIKIVLGSATPDIETYYKAKNKQYMLLEIFDRFGENIALPKVRIVDMRQEMEQQNYSPFSNILRDKIAEKLQKKEQILLFLNKRGMASCILCRDCGHTVTCRDCDVSMTYHQSNTKLICHHCGLTGKPPVVCPECESHSIRFLGAGTEKIETELHKLFPNARIMRADRDTTSKKGSFEKIYNDFRQGKADILIGTQMIGKGLHLPEVNLVGVILADIGLNIPDFRSGERTFQLLTQVAGRSGRKNHGEVIIQSYMPENATIRYARDHDFQGFYKYEITQRELLGYPPFQKVIKLTRVDEDASQCLKEALQVKRLLDKIVDETTSVTAAPALIMRLHGKYRWNIIIKGPNPEKTLEIFLKSEKLKHGWRIDRDPINLT